jgi:hypothetical protein
MTDWARGTAAERRADRCSVRAAARNDPMLGTAFVASRVLLVEQPGGWGPEGLLDSKFNRSVAEHLVGGLGRRGIRVVAIREPGRTDTPVIRNWAFADCRPGFESLNWGQFVADSELLDLDFDNLDLDSAVVDGPAEAYLVCAHGKHDVCCAVEGRPVAAALSRVRPGQVWECSHLGGDRFAANVLVLPLGLMYGRVPVSRVEDLAAATDRGQVLTSLLRGRVGLAAPVQAALAHAHQVLQLHAADELRVLDHFDVTVPGVERAVRVRIASPAGPIAVTVAVEHQPADRLTCHAHTATHAAVYRPISVDR